MCYGQIGLCLLPQHSQMPRFENLPKEYQEIITDASYEAGISGSESVIHKNDEYLQTLIDGGIEVVDCDVEAFRKA